MSLKKTAYFLIIICIATWIVFIGRSILSPIMFAIFFAFMLKPICDKIDTKITNPYISISIAFLSITIPVLIILGFFSSQLIAVVNDLPDIGAKIERGAKTGLKELSGLLGISIQQTETMLSQNMQGSVSSLTSGLTLSISVIANIFLCFIYTFLFLLYRKSFKEFLVIQVEQSKRTAFVELLSRIQGVAQSYLNGKLVVMLLLGILNSIGLFAIGLDYAIFWGFLAAVLAIIPYVGTFLGGFLPLMFSIATAGSMTEPLLVLTLFTIIQAIEGNFITPYIVGNSVNVNALAAIIALILGGTLWGIAGMILSIPILAIFNIIFKEIDSLKPLSILIGDDIYEKEGVFKKKFDRKKFRIKEVFVQDSSTKA